jgi:dolichol-phosphate mannosyltransferase
MTRVLVTGAAGFVGANLVRRLVSDGDEVHAFVRPPARGAGGSGERVPPWRLRDVTLAPVVHVHQIDLRDAPAVMQAVRDVRPDWVFHCAAYGAYSWERDETRIRETIVDGTAHLLDACRAAGVALFVNTGSSSEYGYKDHPASESDLPEPNSAYARAKLAATEQCVAEAQRHGARIVTLRLYSVYGPYEEPNRLMPTLLTAALRGGLPPLVDPATARDFVYVDDICEAYVRIARHASLEPGAIYNVGSGTQTTLADLVEMVRTMFGIAEPPRWGSMPARSWDTNVWCADISKIRTEIGWAPRCPLGEGINRFARWIADHPHVRECYVNAAS